MYFRFDEFDEAIDEAIEDDIKEADGGGTCLSFSFLLLLRSAVSAQFIYKADKHNQKGKAAQQKAQQASGSYRRYSKKQATPYRPFYDALNLQHNHGNSRSEARYYCYYSCYF